jgi:hypothetical protein
MVQYIPSEGPQSRKGCYTQFFGVIPIRAAESRKEGEGLATRVRESSLSCPASTPTRRWTSAPYHSTSRHRRSVTPRHTLSLYFRSPSHFCLVQKVPRGTFVKCKICPLKICSIGSLTMASRNNSSRGKSLVLPAVPSSKLQTLESNANSGSC